MPNLNERSERYSNRLEEKEPEKEYEGKTNYFTGAALVPSRENEKESYQKKTEAGAKFFVTQITYSTSEIINFIEDVNPSKPILVGSAPITSSGRLKFLKDDLNVNGLSKDILKRLKNADDMGDESVKICTEMYQEIKDYVGENNLTLGAYIMPVGNPKHAQEITRNI